MGMNIKRNQDGKQNLRDLRRALDEREDVRVHRMGGNWVLSEQGEDCWYETQLSYDCDERGAIQRALFGALESPEEVEYHARRQAAK